MLDEEKYKKIFSKKLVYFMNLNGKTQIDLINDLGLNKSAVSTWCNGTRLPRMDKIQLLANYFNIERSDLTEEKSEKQSSGYYINNETRQMAQDIFENKELRLLFDASRNASPEDLKMVHDMLLHLKRKENNEE